MKTIFLVLLVYTGNLCLGDSLNRQYGERPGYFDIDSIAPEGSLDGSDEIVIHKRMIQIVSRSLRSENPETSDLLKDLDLIRVNTWDPSEGVLEAIRDSLKSKTEGLAKDGWERLAQFREDDEEVVLYGRYIEDEVKGLFLFLADGSELMCINIVGPLDLENLVRIGDAMGISGMDVVDWVEDL